MDVADEKDKNIAEKMVASYFKKAAGAEMAAATAFNPWFWLVVLVLLIIVFLIGSLVYIVCNPDGFLDSAMSFLAKLISEDIRDICATMSGIN